MIYLLYKISMVELVQSTGTCLYMVDLLHMISMIVLVQYTGACSYMISHMNLVVHALLFVVVFAQVPRRCSLFVRPSSGPACMWHMTCRIKPRCTDEPASSLEVAGARHWLQSGTCSTLHQGPDVARMACPCSRCAPGSARSTYGTCRCGTRGGGRSMDLRRVLISADTQLDMFS